MPNGELFICMFCSDRNSRKGFAALARFTDQFKELQTLCFDILRGTGPLKMNRQLTFWAAKRRLNTRLPREGGEEEKAVDGGVAYKYEENEEQAAAEH